MGNQQKEIALLFGNGQELHDRIAGRTGDFTDALFKIDAGAVPIIAARRHNAFFLDKILVFLAQRLKLDLRTEGFSPSPVSDIATRFQIYLKKLSGICSAAGLELRLDDQALIPLLEKVQSLSSQHSETELLRLLGIVCATALVGPHWFVFETINACNSDCLYCNIHSPSRTPSPDFLKDRLPYDIFSSIVDDLAGMGTDGVTILANGEPLLHPEFARMAVFAKRKGLMVNFFTNGLLLDEKIAKAVVDAAVDEAFVTISAADESTYLALHSKQNPGDYQRVLSNLQRLFRLKEKAQTAYPRVTGVHVICAANFTQTIEMAKQAAELGFEKLRLALIRMDDHNRALALSREDIQRLRADLPEVEKICNREGVELWEGYRFQLEHADDPENWAGDEFTKQGCFIGWGLGLVKANADLSFCCVVKPIANLKQGKRFSDIWSDPFYQTVRVAALNMEKNPDVTFTDGGKLLTNACRHCDNHDINAMLKRKLEETGLAAFLDNDLK